MLVLGGFLRLGGKGVPLNGADDRQAVNGMTPLGGGHDAVLGDKVVLQPLEGGGLGGVVCGLFCAFFGVGLHKILSLHRKCRL